MNSQGSDIRHTCYVEFRVYDDQRFQIFSRFFQTMRTWTRQRYTERQSGEDTKTIANEATFKAKTFTKDEDWMLAFKPDDLQFLGMPPHREAILAVKKWRDMSRKERRTDINKDPQLQTLADFVDMLRQFQNIDYELVACAKTTADVARVDYSTYRYPFEGKQALEEMLLFFGFPNITSDSC